MSCAAMLGIDSCAVEGFRADELEALMVKEFSMDSEKFGVAVMLAFGYRVDEQKVKTRQSKEEVIEWYK